MPRSLTGFILVFFCQLSGAHDFNIAKIDLIETGDSYSMTIQIDKEELIGTVQICGDDNILFETAIKNYILDHFYLINNGQMVTYEIQSEERDDNFIYLRGTVYLDPMDLQELTIHNTLLLETVEGQINIFEIETEGRLRAFKLSSERRETTINF